MFSHAFILGFLDFVVPNLFLSSFNHPNKYWLSVRYEQSVRFQEEDYDGGWCVHFPNCSGTGIASVLRYRITITPHTQLSVKTA